MVSRGAQDPRRQDRRRRPALHAHGGRRRLLRARSGPGRDIAFLLGIVRYAIETNRFHEAYVKIHTSAPLLINPAFGFDEGLFSGFDDKAGAYAKDSWTYQLDAKGMAKTDPTLQDPQCVFQLLKKHVSRYTPEMVERICGTPKDAYLKVCEIVTSTGNAERCGTITYALGWTQHSTGVQMIRAAAILQLLLGNVGRPGGGVNAFRGHSNIQGATDTAGTFDILPGYLKTPAAQWTTLKEYIEANTPKPLGPSMNYWQNYDKFMVSLLKAAYGKAATKENDLRLRLAAEDRRQLFVDVHLRRHVPRQLDARGRQGAGSRGLHLLRDEPGRPRPELQEVDRGALEAQVARRRRKRRDGDLDLLESARAIRSARRLQDSDRGLPASGRRFRREGRDVHQLRALDRSGSGRRSIRRVRRSPTRRSCRGSSWRCASSTRRRAARCPRP